VDVAFADGDLGELEIDPEKKSRLPHEVIRAFRLTMRIIRDAADERDLRAMRSLYCKKLQGDRSHQYSMRLNDQWRLVFEIEKGNPRNRIRVISVEDYH